MIEMKRNKMNISKQMVEMKILLTVAEVCSENFVRFVSSLYSSPFGANSSIR